MPETLLSFRQNTKRVATKKSDRKSSADPLSGSLINSSKERPPRRLTNSIFVTTEWVHQVSEIQNAHHQEIKRDQLDCIHRTLGWLLAYSHCPSKIPFLGFRYRGILYQFWCIPFGLNVGLWAFTKTIAHIVNILAESGIWCLPYLEDLLLIAHQRWSFLGGGYHPHSSSKWHSRIQKLFKNEK